MCIQRMCVYLPKLLSRLKWLQSPARRRFTQQRQINWFLLTNARPYILVTDARHVSNKRIPVEPIAGSSVSCLFDVNRLRRLNVSRFFDAKKQYAVDRTGSIGTDWNISSCFYFHKMGQKNINALCWINSKITLLFVLSL